MCGSGRLSFFSQEWRISGRAILGAVLREALRGTPLARLHGDCAEERDGDWAYRVPEDTLQNVASFYGPFDN
jgi:hypothetical protein